MAVIRIKHSNFESNYKVPEGADTLNLDEWANDDNRVNEEGWRNRYNHEAQLVLSVMGEKKPKTILEIGPGPGVLSEIVQQNWEDPLDYHLIDKKFAKEAFEKAGRKGKFLVKDISEGFDTTDLLPSYDMVICNDTLEHLLNPSRIVQSLYHMIPKDGVFFISVPNWRMGHQFVYRGLFDYDNFLFFMSVHKFTASSVSPSNLQAPFYPRLNSEEEMADELLQSWNWYFTFTPDK